MSLSSFVMASIDVVFESGRMHIKINCVDMLMQLIRQLKGGDENPFGDDTSATPKRILQLLNEASVHTY